MRILVPCPRGRAAAVAFALAALGHPAAAQRTDVEANATVNAGYNQQSQSEFVPDPDSPSPSDIPANTSQRLFMEIRPGISLQSGTPRWTWAAGYVFAGTLSLVGDQDAAYSNAFNGALGAQVTKFTTVTMTANAAQGGTSFQLTQRPADAGQPELRAPGNPNQITASLSESLSTELARQLMLQQTLVGAINAPQDSFGESNSALSASLALERGFERDAIGADVHGSVSWLRPLRRTETPYKTYTSSLEARWNRDFSAGWGGTVSAGVQQVFTDSGSRPLAFLPAGSLSVRYALRDDISGAFDFSHGTATNLQVGSISVTDRLTVRGNVMIDSREARAVAFSAGYLHNEPLGVVAAAVAAGTGDALAADVGFTTRVAKNVQGVVRYNVAYQYGQGGNLPATLAHIFFVGVSASIRNTERALMPVPVRGRRVDGSDGLGFSTVEPEPTEPTPPRP